MVDISVSYSFLSAKEEVKQKYEPVQEVESVELNFSSRIIADLYIKKNLLIPTLSSEV